MRATRLKLVPPSPARAASNALRVLADRENLRHVTRQELASVLAAVRLFKNALKAERALHELVSLESHDRRSS